MSMIQRVLAVAVVAMSFGVGCTVDDPVVARRLKAAGVDSMTTNRPRWLREQLAAP